MEEACKFFSGHPSKPKEGDSKEEWEKKVRSLVDQKEKLFKIINDLRRKK